MEEYKEIMFLYEKYKKKEKQTIWLVGSILLGICAFLYVDLIKVNPVILFGVGLTVSIIFMVKNQFTSKHFDQLEKYIKKHHSEYKHQQEFLFFLDNQLTKIYGTKEDTAELKKALKEKDSQEKLSKQIKDSYFLFESLQKTDKENQLALDY